MQSISNWSALLLYNNPVGGTESSLQSPQPPVIEKGGINFNAKTTSQFHPKISLWSGKFTQTVNLVSLGRTALEILWLHQSEVILGRTVKSV